MATELRNTLEMTPLLCACTWGHLAAVLELRAAEVPAANETP